VTLVRKNPLNLHALLIKSAQNGLDSLPIRRLGRRNTRQALKMTHC
jgi:hypothetical protein